MKLDRFLIDRLDERSTWRGLIFVLTALGLSLSPEQQAGILAAGVAIGGVVEMFLPDPSGKVTKREQNQGRPTSWPHL